ncbi:hypothetical protein HMPREF0731_4392 [Pseudoroseomonas cervicalis ATCC 49957]|uniref:Uncharacterized protein n=2 Tax=Teichococcus cervicalis TaxID=204525 RepID=D5RTI0_9PROT|nr:hypothetical protein HMPREF0731_4392 [Pseudoroseomonas cervicalis ATCC 49957]
MRPFDIRVREVMDHQCRMLPAERAAEFVALEQDRDRLRSIVAEMLPADTMPPAGGAAPVSAANAGEAE